MTDTPSSEPAFVLSNLPAGPGQHRLACGVILTSALVFAAIVPFAKVPLTPVPAFIPLYQSALFISDLVTAVFLFGQSRFSRSDKLVWVGGGYLFTALMSATHVLTFPGIFSPTGLLNAGPQTTAWLYLFWHVGFPCFVVVYALQKSGGRAWRGHRVMAAIGGTILAAVGAFALLATLGERFLPALIIDNHYTAAMMPAVGSVWILNLFALLLLMRRRPYAVLDLWLMVTMCAWLFDIALSALLNAGRYDLGFYSGRIYGLVAASLVLIVLVIENSKLYVELMRLRDDDRAKAVELQRLSTIDALTGIANRRALDDALGQEWRRMLRHKTALSLLLIDVDHFKRFNDTYGHLAGDQCLRTVAQTLAGRARRAGEVPARYGGEEFAVLLPQTDIEEARKLAELMCREVREQRLYIEGSELPARVTASIGVASIDHVPRSTAALAREGGRKAPFGAGELIARADDALYRAKRAGRDRVVVAATSDIADAA